MCPTSETTTKRMPQSSGLGVIGTGSSIPEIQFQAMSVPQRKRVVVAPEAVAAPATTTPGEMPQIIPRATLTVWNAALCLFHATLATTTLVFGNRDLSVAVYKAGVDFQYVDESASGQGDPWDLIPVFIPAGTLYFTWWVASFFMLSSLFHLLNCTVLRSYYLRNLELCYTPTRWVEYFFSASVMIVIIAYSTGVRDRDTLLSVAGLVATTMTLGFWVETVGRPASADEWVSSLYARLLPWFLGHIPQVVAWLLIVLRFYDGALTNADRAPAFVHVILWLELFLFFSFGAASLASQLYPPRLFYRGEIVFQILSLVSKGLLGIVLIVNVLMLSRFEDIYGAGDA